jgi:hypothetical protein
MDSFRTGKAKWKNKDYDMDINVTGDLGVDQNGRRFVSIEGSASGVPLDEVAYESSAKYLSETGVFEVHNSTQQNRAKYLQENMLGKDLNELDIQDYLMTREKYLNLSQEGMEKARKLARNSSEGKAYDNLSSKMRSKYFANREVGSSVFLMPKDKWNNWYINSAAKAGADPAYNTYISLKNPLRVTESQIEQVMNTLANEGFEGQVSHLMNSATANTRIDNIVLRAHNTEDALRGAETVHRVLTDNVEKIWTGTTKGAADSIETLAESVLKARSSLTNAEKVAMESRNLGKKAAKALPGWVTEAGLIAGGIIAAGTVVQAGIDISDKMEERKQLRIQEKALSEQLKNKGKLTAQDYDSLNGLNQQLYSSRMGHSNSWGGRRY